MTGFNDLLDAEEMGVGASPATDAETDNSQDSQDSQESVPVEPEKTVPLKALESERGKRQTYENLVTQQQQQIDILMRAIQAQQPQQPQPQQPSVDILLNPDEWQNRLFSSLESLITQQTFNRTLALSEESARDKYADYDELIDGFFKPAITRQPELLQALYKAPDPAKYAYRQAKRIQQESELGEDIDYNKLKEQIRAEVLAELQSKQTELKKQVKIPESLGTGNSGTTPNRSIPVGGYRAKDLYD